MGKATLAKQRAIGLVGAARAQKLIDAGLTILYTEDYERITARLAELERQNKLLREIATGNAEINATVALVLQEAMRR